MASLYSKTVDVVRETLASTLRQIVAPNLERERTLPASVDSIL